MYEKKPLSILKLNNTFLNNSWTNEKIEGLIRKYLK